MHWLKETTANATAYIRSLPASDVRMAEMLVGGILALFVAWWCWWHLPKRQVDRLPGLIDPKDRGDLENNFRQTITQTVGGLVVLFGAAFAYVQFKEQRSDFQVQQNQFQAQQQAAHDLLISNQVSKGFEDLGSGQLMIRIGGIYALEAVMNTSPQYHQPVLEDLCSFIRAAARNPPQPPTTDVIAIFTVIGRRLEGPGRVDLQKAQLQETELTFGDLDGSDLADANLDSSDLEGTNLSNSVLTRTRLTSSILFRANLQGSFLGYAKMKGADLKWADLRGAVFLQADLTNVILTGAKVTGARFFGASMAGTELTDTDLAGTDITRSQINEACGVNVKGLPKSWLIKPCPPSYSDSD